MNFTDNGCIRWISSLKKFGNPRKSSSNISGFTHRSRDFHQNLSCTNFFSFFYHQSGFYWKVVVSYHLFFTLYKKSRMLGFVPGINDYFLFVPCLFIILFLIGNTFFYGFKLDGSSQFGKNDGIIRVPVT